MLGYTARGLRFMGRLRSLVTAAGGVVEDDIFVTTPGIQLLGHTCLAPGAGQLFDSVNVDTTRPDYEQMAEFGGRLTYLAFPDDDSTSTSDTGGTKGERRLDGEAYNRRMAVEHGHLSPFAPMHATFLIAGCALETSLELIAHSEARVARLTSSKTAAMDDTLYRIQGSAAQRDAQKMFIRSFLRLRAAARRDDAGVSDGEGGMGGKGGKGALASLPRELANMMNLGCKATALTYTMSIKDLHKLFIGRMGEAGNESEVRAIARAMCAQLHEAYPLVVRSPAEYDGAHNSEKDHV